MVFVILSCDTWGGTSGKLPGQRIFVGSREGVSSVGKNQNLPGVALRSEFSSARPEKLEMADGFGRKILEQRETWFEILM